MQLLDVLINHAGILYGVSPDEPDFEKFEVNVFGALQVTHTLLLHSKVELLTVRLELDR